MPQTYTNHFKDKQPILLVFWSNSDGTHFNTALRGTEAVEKFVKIQCKTQGVLSEFDDFSKNLKAWGHHKRTRYGDLWHGFSNESWVTVTFNPNIQDIFRVPMNMRQKARIDNLLPDGTPAYFRAYHYTNKSRPGRPKYDYIVVFTGKYREAQKKRGEEMSGYYHIKMNADPREYFEVFETNEIIDHQYSVGFAVNMGTSTKKMGLRIPWDKLPLMCRRYVLAQYIKLWDIDMTPKPKRRTPGERQEIRKKIRLFGARAKPKEK